MIYLNQKEIDEMIQNLATQIHRSNRVFKQVVGIAYGGLNVSKPLAYLLSLPHTQIYISRYDGQQKRVKPIIEGAPVEKGSLIVDDLIDEGGTIKLFDEHFGLEGNAVAVLFWNDGYYKPEFYVAKKPDDWIHFPWEK